MGWSYTDSSGREIIRDGAVVCTVHTFDSSGEAYDASQCRDEIKDGDVLSVPKERVVGVLLQAWPTAVSEAHGEFHSPVDGFDWAAVATYASTPGLITDPPTIYAKDYSASYAAAVEELARISLEVP